MLWQRIKGSGQREESDFGLGGCAEHHWGSDVKPEPRQMKIPCAGERREGVSQARETCKVCMMSQSKISGWGQLLRKGQCGCSERKNGEKFGKGRRAVGLPRLGWGMCFVSYVTREVTHAFPSGDVPGHPKCRAQEQEQVRTVPSRQRLASPKQWPRGGGQAYVGGTADSGCWRHQRRGSGEKEEPKTLSSFQLKQLSDTDGRWDLRKN